MRAIVVLGLLAVLVAGATLASGQSMTQVSLAPTPLARNANLQGARGSADLDIGRGKVQITVTLAQGTEVPAGSVLEGWLVDAGRMGGPGMSHASDRDQRYGAAFGNAEFAAKSRDIPYALSTGVLRKTGARTYVGTFQISNGLGSYGAVVVTIESDGNRAGYDPRPGTPVLAGEIGR